MSSYSIWILCLFVFLVTAVLLPYVVHGVGVLGLVDTPDQARKIHSHSIPLAGGPAIVLGMVLVCVPFSGQLDRTSLLLILGLAAFFAIGIVDDRTVIPASRRYILQIAITVALGLTTELRLTNLGDLLGAGNILLGRVSLVITAFAVCSLINGFNMLDGMDGLFTTIFVPIICGIIYLTMGSTYGPLQLICVLSLGATLGFTLFNSRYPWRNWPAKVFLGNSGSLMLGGLVTFSLVWISQSPSAVIRPIDAVWIAGLPILDTTNVVIQRLIKRKSAFAAGHEHIHHILLSNGLSYNRVVCLIGTISGLMVLTGVLAAHRQWTESVMFGLFLMVALLYRVLLGHAVKSN